MRYALLWCVLVLILATNAVAGSKIMITLANRQFTPPDGIEPKLIQRLGVEGLFPVHGLAQFYRRPSPVDRARLAKAGVWLSTYLGANAYYASFARNTKLTEVQTLVRWAGLLRIEDKLESSLWRGEIEDWARTPQGLVRILVTFHPDVSRDAMVTVQNNHAAAWRYLDGQNAYAVEFDLKHIRKLAAEEAVRWIEQGPQPFMPL